jgi:hypothetical protein
MALFDYTQSGVTGPRLGLDDFPESQLDSFIYTQGRTGGFKIRDRYLAAGPSSRLRKFVLLGGDQERDHRVSVKLPHNLRSRL